MRVGTWGGFTKVLLAFLHGGIFTSTHKTAITITGRVTDNQGMGLPSVNIIIENTTSGGW